MNPSSSPGWHCGELCLILMNDLLFQCHHLAYLDISCPRMYSPHFYKLFLLFSATVCDVPRYIHSLLSHGISIHSIFTLNFSFIFSSRLLSSLCLSLDTYGFPTASSYHFTDFKSQYRPISFAPDARVLLILVPKSLLVQNNSA